MAQSTLSIRVDDALKKDFDALCNDFGLTSTAAVTVFMKAVVREKKIPFEIKTSSENDEAAQEALAAFERMRAAAAAAGLQDKPLEWINSVIEEVRHERK